MAIDHFDNSILRKYGNFERLVYEARISDLTPNVLLISKFGLNTDLDSGVKEDIWSPGGTKTDTSSADVLEVLSSDANDTSAGTGARTVRVFGYDANYDLITEDVTLNGVTAVETTQSFIDIYRCAVLTAGSGNYNAGNITIRQKTGPVVVGQIPAGYNITQQSHFIIPNGYVGYFQGATAGIGGLQAGAGDKSGTISLETMAPGGVWIRGLTIGATSSSGPTQFRFPITPKYAAKTRIKATSTCETNNSEAEVLYSLVLIKEEYVS